MDPEVQLLQSKLLAKREEVEQVRKSKLGNALGVSYDPLATQRRTIPAREANIRRVHNSRIWSQYINNTPSLKIYKSVRTPIRDYHFLPKYWHSSSNNDQFMADDVDVDVDKGLGVIRIV